MALACAAALSACQPKPTTTVAAAAPIVAPLPGAVPQAAPGVMTTQPAPTIVVQVPAPVVVTLPANAAPAAVTSTATGATQPAPAVVTTQPVPVDNDAGPPPARTAAPVALSRPARVARPAAAPIPGDRVGRVTSVAPIRERPEGSGAGGVAGAALGGLVGNHFGHGGGRAALTVLGVAGGALAGNQVERRLRERTVGYQVDVRLDNGEVRSFDESSAALRVGDRVRVVGGALRRI